MIRDATPEDAAAIAAIWNPIIRDSLATFNTVEKSATEVAGLIRLRHDAGQCFVVAQDAGQVLGFATYDQFRGGIGYRHSMEHTVHLQPAARGLGLGRVLMARLERQAKDAGVHVMMAGVAGENTSGRDFHLAIGYQISGTIPQIGRKFDRWMDLWLMHKILT